MIPRPAEDPELTLSIDVNLAAPRDVVWRCWTESDLLRQWFCPLPWQVSRADFDLRPGGRMNIDMQGPNGEEIEIKGIWLEIEPPSWLVFTDTYREGYIPQPDPFMTGFVELSETDTGGTRMVWGARHSTPEQVQKHLEMGFEEGWTTSARQLEAKARQVAGLTPESPPPHGR